MSLDLERLLRPGSIAVFGGSWAKNVIDQCQRAGFDGEVWPVHPRHDSIGGLTCYRSVDDLPRAPDASFIGVNRHLTIEIITRLRDAGAGGAVCFASGFSEAEALTGDGESLQQALIEAAGDMPVLGPNCYGLINYLDGALLWPDQHGGVALGKDTSGVALVMQSSNIAINCTMQARGLPLAYVICAGNQAHVDSAQLVDGLLDDPRVTAVGMHIEGLADIAAFERVALKARALRKPVVAIKVGRSEQAREATLSHTASVAGSDAGSRAFFHQLGVPLVKSLPALLETLKLLHVHGPLPGRDISSMSCSGGEASLVADSIIDHKLQFRALDDAQKQRIRDTLNELVVPANPLDYHTFIWEDEAAMTATFSAMLSSEFDLNMLVIDFPRTDRCDDSAWDPAIAAIAAAARNTGQRVAAVTSLPENMSERHAREFMNQGIAPLHGIDDALVAIDMAASIADAWGAPVPQLWSQSQHAESRVVSPGEFAAKRRLAEFGIVVPPGGLADTVEKALQTARRIGYPVVAKLSDHAHKSESDGVRLNLAGDEALQQAATQLLKHSGEILVEKMIAGSRQEFLIGVHRDPVYGYLMTIGAGGVMVELLDDACTLRMPATEAQIRSAVTGLRCAALLEGFRGQPALDSAALIETALNVQRYVEAHQNSLVELDLNPLMVGVDGEGVIAADALIVERP